MSSFPFLNLPFVVQEKIIEEINSADIILLIFTSTRMRKVVRNCRIKLEKALWALEKNTLRARLYFEKLQGRCFSEVLVKHCDEAEWNHQYQCYFNKELKNGNLRHNTTMSDTLLSMTIAHRTHPCPLFIQRIHYSGYIIYARDVPGATTSQEMTCAIIEDLLNVFKIDQNNLLAFDISSTQYSAYFDHFPKFDDMEICVRKAQWVTTDWLLNVRSRTVKLSGDNLSSEDLNIFIKQWLRGGYDQLQEVRVIHSRNDLNKDIILKDIPTSVWNAQTRPNYFLFLNDRGTDIRRSDGEQASLFLEPTQFVFKVWT